MTVRQARYLGGALADLVAALGVDAATTQEAALSTGRAWSPTQECSYVGAGRAVAPVEQGPAAWVEHDQAGLAVLVDLAEDLRQGHPGDVGLVAGMIRSKWPVGLGHRLGPVPDEGVAVGRLDRVPSLLVEHPRGLGDSEVIPRQAPAGCRVGHFEGSEPFFIADEGLNTSSAAWNARLGRSVVEQLGFGSASLGLVARHQRIAEQGRRHALRRGRLSGIDASRADECVEFAGATLVPSWVITSVAATWRKPWMARSLPCRRPDERTDLEHDAQRQVADADHVGRPAAGLVLVHPVVGGRGEDRDGRADALEAGVPGPVVLDEAHESGENG